MNKKNIYQVVAYYPPHIGGMEYCVQEISEKMAGDGFSVTVLTSNIGVYGKKDVGEGVKVRYLSSFEIAHTPIIPSLFFRLLFIPRNSIIHLHISQAFLPEIVYMVSKIRHIPFIAHVHLDVGPSGRMGFLLPVYKKFILKYILRSADKIIVPTSDYVSLLCTKYNLPEEKLICIPNGVDLGKFKMINRKPTGPTRLLFVGRLSKQKNIPLLIESFKKVSDKFGQGLELHIAGDGEEKNRMISLIHQYHLDGKVLMHGMLSGENRYNIYANSHLFILTSREESFGLVLIEAMASGLPIVASDIPGLRNVVENGKTGILVKPTSDNFAAAVGKLISDSRLRKYFIENGIKAVKKYDWQQIAGNIEDIYTNITV